MRFAQFLVHALDGDPRGPTMLEHLKGIAILHIRLNAVVCAVVILVVVITVLMVSYLVLRRWEHSLLRLVARYMVWRKITVVVS